MIALGGGLDAALVLSLFRAAGRPIGEAVTLQTDMPGYDESERAERVATALGARLYRVRVTAQDFLGALPEAIGHIEQPLYNLHPVSRLLLSRAAARLGARTLVTGDGADQALSGRPSADYLPLVAALTEGAGLALWSPFLDEAVIASALRHGPDPDKARLRALARAMGVPAWVVSARKVPQRAPRLDLSRYLDAPALALLSTELGAPLSLGSDREAVGWVTLALARRCLAGEAFACAG
jgi:asparagine synthetase B (glutamine-hydrolysing)